MNEKFEIFKRHFKANFLTASAFFLVWFIVYNPLFFLIGRLSRTLHLQGGGATAANILGLVLYAAFYYALWVGVALIFDGKFKQEDFFKTAFRQLWFLGALFVFQALIMFWLTVAAYMGLGVNDGALGFMIYFNFAVGAAKIFFTCVFLITARLDVSLTEGLKEKLKDNWPVFAAFVGASLVFYIILLVPAWLFMYAAPDMPGGAWGLRIIMFAGSFISQYGFYVIAPFTALPFVVMPSEKTN